MNRERRGRRTWHLETSTCRTQETGSLKTGSKDSNYGSRGENGAWKEPWEMRQEREGKLRSLKFILNGELVTGLKQRDKVISGFTRMPLAASVKAHDSSGFSNGRLLISHRKVILSCSNSAMSSGAKALSISVPLENHSS